MKLAFCLFKYFPYGGLERDFLRIALACRERGHDITVFIREWQGPIPPGLKVNILHTPGMTSHGRARRFAREVAFQIDEGKFDVVIGFNKMPGLDLYYAADPCYQQRMSNRYGGLYKLNPRYRSFVAMEEAVFGVHSTAEIMLLSPAEQGFFSRYYHTPPERFHLLPPTISRDRIAPPNAAALRTELRREFAIGDNHNLLLMIGSGFNRKGLDRILLGLASLPAEIKKITRLMVLGEDDPRPYLRMAKRLGVSEQLHMLGGRDDVPRFLLGADLLVHPARSENTGTVLLEAVAAGLPVLVTAVCGYAFHIAKAGAGCVVPDPFEQPVFDNFLHEMLTSAMRETWRTNALNYAKTTDLYSMPERVVELIERRHRRLLP